MSPGARCWRRSAMVASTAAAGTISHTARGVSSFFTRSATDEAPTALACTSSSTALADRSKTTHRWPPAIRRWTMLAPIRPSPIIPSCMAPSSEGPIVRRRSRVGRLEDALDRRVKQGVVLGVGLLGGQAFDQRPRIARDDAVIPAQTPVAFVSCVAARQGNHPHDLGMADELGVEIVRLREGELEHEQLTGRQGVELLPDGRFEELFGGALVRGVDVDFG